MVPCTLSFEFFPPRSEAAGHKLYEAAGALAALEPAFMTVTFGAGGTTQEGTESAVLKIQKDTGVPVAMHLTYINFTIAECIDYLDELWAKGIKRLVALRGDLPPGLSWPLDPDGDYFQYTSDFVTAIKARHPFDVSVGAYPEKHPDAPDLSSDIRALKIKCDAGADRAITQFFFDNDVYYRFIDAVRKAGIATPIVPGILPISDFAKMKRFAESCGAGVPEWLYARFDGLEDKPQEQARIAQEIFTAQIEDLCAHGIKHFHIYTMNKSEMILNACDTLKEYGLMQVQKRRPHT